MRLEEQAEDCQNKFGVRVTVQWDQEQGAGRTDGGRALCDQLLAGYSHVLSHLQGKRHTNRREWCRRAATAASNGGGQPGRPARQSETERAQTVPNVY